MLTKVKKLYEQARAKVVGLHDTEVYEPWEKIDNLTDEVEAKDLELQTMQGLEEEATKLWSEVTELREALAKDEANVAMISGLQKKISAVMEAVAESLPAA